MKNFFNRNMLSTAVSMALLAPALASADQVFDLRVSYYDNNTNAQTRRTEIEANFKKMAEALYESTNGAHKLGKVSVYLNGAYKDNADVVWVNTCHPNAQVNGRGKSGSRIEHCDSFSGTSMLEKSFSGGYTLMHEWGHFAYGLLDEYQNKEKECKADDPGGPCRDDVPTQKTIMQSQDEAIAEVDGKETLGDLNPLNFSSAANFSMKTAQGRVHGASAWETLVRDPAQDPQLDDTKGRKRYDDLIQVAPAAGQLASLELSDPQKLANATSALKIEFFEVSNSNSGSSSSSAAMATDVPDENAISTKSVIENPVSHNVKYLLIDHSSEVSADQLEEIKATVQNIVDEAHAGTIISIIAYDQAAETLVDHVTITDDASKKDIIQTVEDITSSETLPSLDSAFNLSLESVSVPTDTSNVINTSNAIYIFGSGLNTGSDAPLDLVGAIGDKNVIVNIFGSVDTPEVIAPLENVAEKTRGIFRLASTGDEYFDALEEADQAASPDVDSTLATGDVLLKKGNKDIPFYVDNTLDVLNLNISYEGDPSTAQITLIDPKGVKTPFGEEECGNVVQEADEDSVQDNFCNTEISSPKTGKWILRVAATQPTNLNYAIDGTSKHGESKIFAQVDFDKNTNLVTASVSEEFPMTGLTVTGLLTKPDGKTSKFVLTDNGKGADGKANDGIYHGKLDKPMPGKYSLDVVFDNQGGKAKITNATGKYINGGVLEVSPFKNKFVRSVNAQLDVVTPTTPVAPVVGSKLPPKVGGKPATAGATGTAGASSGAGTIPSQTVTVQLIEEVKQGVKGSSTTTQSNTFRLEPTGQTFSGPVRVCMKYTSNDDRSGMAYRMTNALKGMLKEIKDSNGKPSYQIPTIAPEDDKFNSQLCQTLRSF